MAKLWSKVGGVAGLVMRASRPAKRLAEASIEALVGNVVTPATRALTEVIHWHPGPNREAVECGWTGSTTSSCWADP